MLKSLHRAIRTRLHERWQGLKEGFLYSMESLKMVNTAEHPNSNLPVHRSSSLLREVPSLMYERDDAVQESSKLHSMQRRLH